MHKQTIIRILVALTVISGILVFYNASNTKDNIEDSASDRIATYLRLNIIKEEASQDGSAVELNADGTPKVVVTDKNGTPVSEAKDEPSDQAEVSSTQPESPAPSPTDTGSSQQSPSSTVPEPATSAGKPETVYTVKEGDTYGCIAERYYGSYEHWVDIVRANPQEVGFGEYQLFVDARLVLPAIPASELKPASDLCS